MQLEPDQVESFCRLIEQEINVLSEGLKGRCSQTDNYHPRNLTVKNFSDFISLPTLVYELEYPRTEKINWLYVAEKTAATFGIIVVMIAVSQSWIYPVVVHTVQMKEHGLTVQQRLREFPWVLSDLLFPFMMEYLLAFYVIWECVVSFPWTPLHGEACTDCVAQCPGGNHHVCRSRVLLGLVEFGLVGSICARLESAGP